MTADERLAFPGGFNFTALETVLGRRACEGLLVWRTNLSFQSIVSLTYSCPSKRSTNVLTPLCSGISCSSNGSVLRMP